MKILDGEIHPGERIGLAFELGDEDGNDWNELTAPIEWIYIYKHYG